MSEADIGESNADQNGKCRYCGMDLAHCICGKTRGESCAVGCGDDGCTFAASHAYETEREHALERREILVLAAGAALLAASFFFAGTAQIALRIASYLTAGGGVLLKTVKGVRRGRFFDENALMSIATVGAICLGDFAEAAAVMVFYGVGEGLQEAAVRRSRKRISDAVALHPDRARRVTDGLQESVPPEEVAVGETILVRTGERVPLDGEVLEGSSLLDVSMLTGEPRPVRAARGDAVSAGSVSTTGPLTVRVTRPAAESSTSRLLKAVEDAMRSKPSLERFITRFSRVYTPAMIGAAALLAVLPPLLGAGEWSDWIRRALIFLVISCPCALVLSIPLTFFAGLAVTSKNNFLLKGADALVMDTLWQSLKST